MSTLPVWVKVQTCQSYKRFYFVLMWSFNKLRNHRSCNWKYLLFGLFWLHGWFCDPLQLTPHLQLNKNKFFTVFSSTSDWFSIQHHDWFIKFDQFDELIVEFAIDERIFLHALMTTDRLIRLRLFWVLSLILQLIDFLKAESQSLNLYGWF